MTIKAVLDSDQFGELDEALKGLYKEDGDNYVIDAEGVDDLPVVKQALLKRKISEDHKKRAETKNKDYEHRFGPLLSIDDLDLSDVDPERIENLRPYLTGEAEIPTGNGNGGEGKTPEEIERIRANARKPVEKELDKASKKADTYEALFRRECVTNTLTAEFSRAGVKDPDFLELLIDRYSPKCKIEIEDGEVKVLVDSEYGEVNPKEFCKEWAGTDYARKFIASADNQGGGAGGGGGGAKLKNPWSPEHFNLSEQGRIVKADPERAKRMAAEYGKTVGA